MHNLEDSKDARKIAKNALTDVTAVDEVGRFVKAEIEDNHSTTFYFKCRREAYTGWDWAVTLTRVDSESPITVSEMALLPGNGALVAAKWVPWAMRLAEFRKQQKLAEEQSKDDTNADDTELKATAEDLDNENDILENDHNDIDQDIDGVDIDSLQDAE